MARLLAVSVALVVCSLNVVAQLLPDPLDPPGSHVHSPAAGSQLNPGMIDGAQHPELIPDSTAYRLFLVAVEQIPNITAAQTGFKKAHILRLGLNDNDAQAFAKVVENFRTRYDDLIKNYNDAAEVALPQGQAPDYDTFLRQRDALVQNARDDLSKMLTAEGMSKMDAVIQSEKSHMMTTPTATAMNMQKDGTGK
jgi:hypothetical protein